MGYDKEFWVVTEPSSSLSRHGPLCRDMVHRLEVAPELRHGLMLRHNFARVGENLRHDRGFSSRDRIGHDG